MRTNAAPLGWGWTLRAGVGLIGLAVAFSSSTPLLRAQSPVYGEWRTLARTMPINPVHAAVMNNGKVLIVSGSGNVAAETNFRSAVLDVQADSLSVINSQPWDMFCNGMVVLHDGRVFINGGNLKYDPFWGEKRNAVFDPATGLFTDVQSMASGRWYPTTTTLGDGRVMSYSGLDENSSTNTTVEIYTVGSGWSQQYTGGWTPPLYPRLHLLPTGKVIYVGDGPQTRLFDPNATPPSWSGIVANTNYTGTRTYGTSVLLPLRPSDGYKARVMILGGGNPSTNRTEILDTSASPLAWQEGPRMTQSRTQMNATILPNGKVLATGGSLNNEDTGTASRNADLYDPASNTFSLAGQNASPRLYHSNALLLPDATVLLLGGNPARGTYNDTMEIYSPAYLFTTDPLGNTIPSRRPTIEGTPGPISYGASFQVSTPDAADITSVVLVRPGAATHAFDMEQRLVELPFTVGAGALNVTGPPNGNIAPPGYYMLFILNSAGVPSVATFVRVLLPGPNQAPTAIIDSPATNATVNPGGSVAFSGSGTDSDGTIASYAWTFTGGSPSSSSSSAPNVTYPSPGSYQANLTVTDNGGLTSSAATRTITVSDFSVTATPSSNSTMPGGTAAYSATVGALSGFTGTVALTVSGLPAGATATFAPTSINTSGSSGLSVATSATTPSGTYTLTIRGSSGPVVHTNTVTLVVLGDFTITATPTSRTVQNGTSATYTISFTPSDGFNGSVSLSVGALPKFVNATFSPAAIAQSSTSMLTLTTKKQTKAGTSTVTVNGTSGTLSHSTTITLIVQ